MSVLHKKVGLYLKKYGPTFYFGASTLLWQYLLRGTLD